MERIFRSGILFAGSLIQVATRAICKPRYIKKTLPFFVATSLVIATFIPMASPAQAATNLVSNGSFETPEVTDPANWDIFSSVPNWTVEWVDDILGTEGLPRTPFMELQRDPLNSWSTHDTEEAGMQWTEMDSDWDGPGGQYNGEPASVKIYQDIDTDASKLYKLSFWVAPRPGHGTDDCSIEVHWGGATDPLAPITLDGSGDNVPDWQLYEYSGLPASDGWTRLSFMDVGTPNSFGMLLDDVQLEEMPVPELEMEKVGEYNNETGIVTYTINWWANGEGTLYDTAIEDYLPAGTTYVDGSADATGGEYSAPEQKVYWRLYDVTAGDNGTVSFQVYLDAAFASSVIDNDQGQRKDGSDVLAGRSNPANALGYPQSNGTPGDPGWQESWFYSLGFADKESEASITLGFEVPILDGPGNDLKVFEVTGGGTYPIELASVYAKQNLGDPDWTYIDKVFQDDEIDFNGLISSARYIKLVDSSNPADFEPTADGYDVDAVLAYYPGVCGLDNTATMTGWLMDLGEFGQHEGDPKVTTEAFTSTDINPNACPITIIAHKIVCDSEADLPNWGEGGPDITATTAQKFVDQHPNCHFQEDWEFQWGPQGAYDPGDTLVGPADPPWQNLPLTDVNGKTEIVLTVDDFADSTYLWFREVLQDGYIPFTHDQNGNSNADDVSAEMYAHVDVLNYDNYDRIDGIQPGHTYYAVGFNVLEEEEDECDFGDQTGWFGQYYNYDATHLDMNLPQNEWPDDSHGDPLSGTWDTDWYDSQYLVQSQVDPDLNFGDNFFPLDGLGTDPVGSGHNYHFGIHWSGKVTISTEGDYDFTLKSDDDAWVYLNGGLVKDNSGIHQPTENDGSMHLTVGTHIVDVFFAERHTVQSWMSFAFEDQGLQVLPYNAACPVPEEPKVTIIASKIVCDSEDLLPNWGDGDGEGYPAGGIDGNTAQDFVDSHQGCRLVPDWQFQWAPEGTSNPGDNTGEAGSWHTLPATDANGETTITLTAGDIGNSNYLWFREIPQEGYIPFSGWLSNGSNVPTADDEFSAEVYATTDVLNYDNYDRIEGIEVGQTYYAVAFNVSSETTITGMKFNDHDGMGDKDEGDEGLEGWVIKAVDPEPVDVVIVPSDEMTGADSDVLPDDDYLLIVEGQWDNNINKPGDGNLRDAEYFTSDGWNTHTDGNDLGADQADLMVDDAFVDWGPYSGEHIYYLNYELAEDGPINFSVFDGNPPIKNPGWYGDNNGELTVTIYRVVDVGTTDVNGDYELTIPIDVGHVLVFEIPQRTWTQTFPQTVYYDVVIGQSELTGLDFGNHGEDIPGTITGMKFNDHDGMGDKDEGDEGLAGWTIYAGQLYDELDVEAQNDAEDGASFFTNKVLESGQKYIIRAEGTFEAGDGITADAQYSKRSFAPDPDAWTDDVHGYGGYGVKLLDLWIRNNFSLWGSYNPSHVYWHTLVGDGMTYEFHIHDIYAYNNSGSLNVKIYNVIDTAITDSDGNYELEIPAEITGDVVVAEETQDGWVQTYPMPEGYHEASADGLTDGLDFGNRSIEEEDEPEPTGSIAGIKFHDHNGNGEKDSEDGGLSGWTIYLDLNNDGDLDVQEPFYETEGDGSYNFAGLPADTYVVREVPQSTWSQTFPHDITGAPVAYSLPVGDGEGEWDWVDIDFGNWQPGGPETQGEPGGPTGGGGGGGGGYYTPPTGSNEEVGGEQQTNPALALNEPVNEAVGGEQLPAAGTPTFIVMSLAALVSLLATSFTYRRKQSEFEE
ncbi:hypothetical protein JXA59_02590 [Patescibacteria group bacterium]|nr:hypothetical protein [Patescibacteria group bacterium]